MPLNQIAVAVNMVIPFHESASVGSSNIKEATIAWLYSQDGLDNQMTRWRRERQRLHCWQAPKASWTSCTLP